MEDDVASAKAVAKAKAKEWAELNASGQDPSFAEAAKHISRAKELFEQITGVEGEVSRTQQKIVQLQDKRAQLEKETSSHSTQIDKLRDKREELERQKEEGKQRIKELSGVKERHEALKAECEACSEEVRTLRQ